MKKLVLAIFSVLSLTANAAVIELDFSDAFANYSNQFETGTVSAVNGGKTLSMFGNNWVAFEGVYNITADTILQVTFSSSQLGELHGFGFDNDIIFDSVDDYKNGENRYFQFAGTQTFGVQDYNTYSVPNTIETFTVEVGKFLTGTFSQLVFIEATYRFQIRSFSEHLITNYITFSQLLVSSYFGIITRYWTTFSMLYHTIKQRRKHFFIYCIFLPFFNKCFYTPWFKVIVVI